MGCIEDYKNGQALGANDFKDSIPFLQFPRNWQIKIIPNHAGSTVRFLVSKQGKKGFLSVYLDCHDNLGYMQQPYWEVYPVGDDTARSCIGNTVKLLSDIRAGLKQLTDEGI